MSAHFIIIIYILRGLFHPLSPVGSVGLQGPVSGEGLLKLDHERSALVPVCWDLVGNLLCVSIVSTVHTLNKECL